MKKNLPITNTEVYFGENEEIISTTDLKGAINGFNDTFLKISGFTAEELYNKNHNIVRHPDMPEAAFADLWQHIKANKHWMGIVKNRCKNGDFYWVDAYVTPVVEKGQVIGYESVRTKPSVERVARAEKIYQQINVGKTPKLGNVFARLTLKSRIMLVFFMALIFGMLAFISTPASINYFPFIVGNMVSLGGAIMGLTWALSPLKNIVNASTKNINNPLMALIYTGRSDELGQLQLKIELLKAKSRTILGRLKEVSVDIEKNAKKTAEALAEINSSIQQQAAETESVATAMTEMTATVQEVARNAFNAAEKAGDTDKHSQEGVQHASGAVDGLQGLAHAVQNVSQVVSQLDNDTQSIGTVIDVIKGIAEQTNLLALNAAIEAARAGEQGRGFAVVADEVRTLAGRTQDSTQEIQQLIENLNATVAQAVIVMGDSEASASNTQDQVAMAIESLGLIAEQVGNMNNINTQIATAVEEQRFVSEDINKNIIQISQNAECVLSEASKASIAGEAMSEKSHHLTDMIQRFQEK